MSFWRRDGIRLLIILLVTKERFLVVNENL